MGNVKMGDVRCEFTATVTTDLCAEPLIAKYDNGELKLHLRATFEQAKEFIHKLAISTQIGAQIMAEVAAADSAPPKPVSTTTLPTAESANKILDRIASDRRASVKAASAKVNEAHSATLQKLADVADLLPGDVPHHSAPPKLAPVAATQAMVSAVIAEPAPVRDAIVERVDAGVMVHLDDIPESIRNANTLREVLSGLIEDGVGKLAGQAAINEAVRRCLVLRKGGRVPALNRIAADALEERVHRAAELIGIGASNA